MTTPILISSFAGLSVLFLVLWLNRLFLLVPEEDREFKDPLPWLLRFVWPLVRVIAYHVCALLPFSYLGGVEARLRRNGVEYLMIGGVHRPATPVGLLHPGDRLYRPGDD